MFAVAWQGVVGFRLRTLLTALCLMLAVTGVVSVNAATQTIEATVIHKALLTGGPKYTFTASGLAGMIGLLRAQSARHSFETMFGSSTARQVSVHGMSVVKAGGTPIAVDVLLVDASLREIRPFPVIAGRWLDARAWLSPRICVNGAAESLLPLDATATVQIRPSGDSLRVVVGCVVDDGSRQPTAYSAIDDWKNVLALNAENVNVSFQFTSPGASVDQVRGTLSRWDAMADTHTDWDVARTDTISELEGEVAATKSTFTVIGAVGLLASTLAIANIGLSAIRERSSEFSVRRALGARRGQLVRVVLLESQIVAVAAGLLSIPLSLALFPFVSQLFGAPFGVTQPTFPWSWAGVGVLVGMGAGLVGALPAMVRSFRVPIANVMRE